MGVGVVGTAAVVAVVVVSAHCKLRILIRQGDRAAVLPSLTSPQPSRPDPDPHPISHPYSTLNLIRTLTRTPTPSQDKQRERQRSNLHLPDRMMFRFGQLVFGRCVSNNPRAAQQHCGRTGLA